MADEKKATEAVAATEVKTPQAPEPEQMKISELTMLQTKANTMGVPIKESDTVDQIKEKIELHLNPPEASKESKKKKSEADTDRPETDQEIRQRLFESSMFLVRVRITNMNPSKADIGAEMHTVSNKYLGAVTRVIPYGEQIDGWHVEKILLDYLREKQFQQIRVVKGPNGQQIPQTKWVKEFAIEELPPLSPEELRVLANRQAAADGRAV
jgi:hypothetical protein